MRTIERDIVSAVLVSADGKIFQGLSNPLRGGVYPDCWKIPGGGTEEGEDKETTLRREVFEETGIDISRFVPELVQDSEFGMAEKTLKDTGERVNVHMNFFTYRVLLDKRANDIPVRVDDEFSDYRWCSPEELKELKIPEPSRVLFKQLGYL